MLKFTLSPHAWLFFEIAIIFNVVVFLHRSRRASVRSPEKRIGFRKIILGFAFWGSLPWLAMAVGLESRNVETFFEYLSPDWRDPYHLAFLGSIITIWIAGTRWLLGKGAAFLVEHRELFGSQVITERSLKLQWFLGLAGGIVALILLSSGFFQNPFAKR